MRCEMCKFKLHAEYVKYKDTNNNPYCYNCYIVIGGRP